jgi:uncharacterized membrane protein (UPF0127 family)
MKLVVWESPEDQARGLQFLPSIDPEALYIFLPVDAGSPFHSRNVREPFDIAFLNEDLVVLEVHRIIPEAGGATAPAGTLLAVEAKAGVLQAMGAWAGRRMF